MCVWPPAHLIRLRPSGNVHDWRLLQARGVIGRWGFRKASSEHLAAMNQAVHWLPGDRNVLRSRSRWSEHISIVNILYFFNFVPIKKKNGGTTILHTEGSNIQLISLATFENNIPNAPTQVPVRSPFRHVHERLFLCPARERNYLKGCCFLTDWVFVVLCFFSFFHFGGTFKFQFIIHMHTCARTCTQNTVPVFSQE